MRLWAGPSAKEFRSATRGAEQSMRFLQTRAGRQQRVLLAGEEPVRSAPCLSLAEGLRGQGIEVMFGRGVESLSTTLRIADRWARSG